MSSNVVYLISDITEFGKLVAFCIDHDISIFRTYWDEREAGRRCYKIDWFEKRCGYASKDFYVEEKQCKIKIPVFKLDDFGKYIIELELSYEETKK